MSNPLVSVIIPNYNHANYLDERFQSVLNQTYQNFEVIILDDKSTDNSLEVINKYKDDPHISCVVVNKENSGSPFKQWHKGFELAKGEIIWIAESDDSCDKAFLDILVRKYIEHKTVLAFCRSCVYDANGDKTIFSLQNILSKDMVMSGNEFISRYMVSCNSIANASSVIFNRKIAMSIDKRYSTMKAEGDWLFWVCLMKSGNVSFCSNELNYFRFHDSNTTSNSVTKGISAIEHKITFDYLVENRYLTGSSEKYEKLKLLNFWIASNFDSVKTKRKVLNKWDKYRFGRLYLLAANLKTIIKLLISLFY